MLIVCGLSAFCMAPIAAQSRADLSGEWTMDQARSGSSSEVGVVGPVVWIIQQTGDRLILERKRGADTDPFTYTLLASRATSGERAIKAPTADVPGHVGYWDGDRLVLETYLNIQGKTVTAREVLTLTGAGELIVERVVEVEHGYTMKGAKNFSSATDVFTRRR
jgi:hypothetical protein